MSGSRDEDLGHAISATTSGLPKVTRYTKQSAAKYTDWVEALTPRSRTR